jgi:DNA polymerase III alpha subunit
VGRVLQLPLGQVDRLAKMVPANPANPVTLAKAIEIEPRLQQARAVLRDVGRVLQLPLGLVDRLAKMVPNNPANPVSLAKSIEIEPRLQEARKREEGVAELLDIALQLEGLYRNASTHAAGIVIGDRPLTELVPLHRDPRSEMPATQFNMKWVESAGPVKFDFLGLKTLTVIDRAMGYLRRRGADFPLDEMPLDDAGAYEIMSSAQTLGVFQMEGQGMRDILRQLRPQNLEEVSDLISLYRPGPMDSIPEYVEVKAGRKPIDVVHPLIEAVLGPTFGVIVYQEQVMKIAQILAGYSLGEADLLRRAMGKKKKAEMDQQRARFLAGAAERGLRGGRRRGALGAGRREERRPCGHAAPGFSARGGRAVPRPVRLSRAHRSAPARQAGAGEPGQGRDVRHHPSEPRAGPGGRRRPDGLLRQHRLRAGERAG